MKRQSIIKCAIGAILVSIVGCTKMDHYYKDFLEGGEITYVGRVDSIKVYPGDNRVKLSWKVSPDPAVRYAMIYWLHQGVNDSLQVPFNHEAGIDTAFAVIENLGEGDYVFNIRTFNDLGDRSVNMEKAGKVYGDNYREFIEPTGLASAAYKDGEVQMRWLLNTDTTALGSNVYYTNNDGKAASYFVGPSVEELVLSDLDYTQPVQYQTLYKPDPLAIDTFYTAMQTIAMEIANPNLIDHSRWELLEIAPGVTFVPNEDGSILASGGSGGHAGVFQAVEVEADQPYILDMTVSGAGATDTWFEVYVGQVVPEQGQEYADGGNRMGLNTWTGCGKTPFDGQLSMLRCVGSGGRLVFPESGTVYLVIRAGGTNLGNGGITLRNIELRAESEAP